MAKSSNSTNSLPLTYESRVWKEHPTFLVCGIDEAGRGPLAGPVVAAACIMLHPSGTLDSESIKAPVDGINDSKTVEEEDRERIFEELIKSKSLCFGISVIDHRVIDRINVLQATMLGMTRAFAAAKEEANRRNTTKSKSIEIQDVHTVYIDGPLCPFRLAAATTGEDPDIPKDLDTINDNTEKINGPPDFGADIVELRQSQIDGGFASIIAEQNSLQLESTQTSSSSSFSSSSSSTSSSKKRARSPKKVITAKNNQAIAELESSMYGRGLQSRLGKITSLVPVIKGDSKVFTIAAASIVAKVTRDRIMRKAEEIWPGYGFSEHKGYGTASHMLAIRTKGASPIHRLTFAPMKTMYPELAEKARGSPLVSKMGEKKKRKRT